MIYITGDTHGLIDFQKLKTYFSNIYVSKKDYLIILGDVGLFWDEKDNSILQYEFLGLTILFIDGNHENFHLLNKFPVVDAFGAKMHQLSENIYHIVRGEVFFLNGLSFLGIGGATSIDRYRRIKDVSYWDEENVTQEDINNALTNLKKVDGKVDYVLTHCAPAHIHEKVFGYSRDNNCLLLEDLSKQLECKHWYFGHYHQDWKIDDIYRLFYQDIEAIPSFYRGSPRAIAYYYSEGEDGYLRTKSWRRTRLRSQDLPEYYYENYIGYRTYYYCLKGVVDVAFQPSWTENHLDKDARMYFSYTSKHRKDKYLAPKKEDEWDVATYRAYLHSLILGLEKYSPELNLRKLKIQYNSAVNRFNNFCFQDQYSLLPYPKLPFEKDYLCFKRRIPYQFEINYQGKSFGYFEERERAESYLEWLKKEWGTSYEETSFVIQKINQ